MRIQKFIKSNKTQKIYYLIVAIIILLFAFSAYFSPEFIISKYSYGLIIILLLLPNIEYFEKKNSVILIKTFLLLLYLLFYKLFVYNKVVEFVSNKSTLIKLGLPPVVFIIIPILVILILDSIIYLKNHENPNRK